MKEATLSHFRSHAKLYFDAVERGETVRIYRNGRPVADLVPARTVPPAWRNPPESRLESAGLQLSREILADREGLP